MVLAWLLISFFFGVNFFIAVLRYKKSKRAKARQLKELEFSHHTNGISLINVSIDTTHASHALILIQFTQEK